MNPEPSEIKYAYAYMMNYEYTRTYKYTSK